MIRISYSTKSPVLYLIATALLGVTNANGAEQVRTFKLTEDVTLLIEKGDITKSKVQAIVNPANENLAGGAGVCGAIFNAAGWDKLQQACDEYSVINHSMRCLTGLACITDSFGLKVHGIQYIIHAVGPDCRIVRNEQQQNTLLKSTYESIFIVAEKNEIESIAIPFISSGIYAFPKERAAHIALATTLQYAQDAKSIKVIHFVLWEQGEVDLFCTQANQLLTSAP